HSQDCGAGFLWGRIPSRLGGRRFATPRRDAAPPFAREGGKHASTSPQTWPKNPKIGFESGLPVGAHPKSPGRSTIRHSPPRRQTSEGRRGGEARGQKSANVGQTSKDTTRERATS